jgi:hypothetical protein
VNALISGDFGRGVAAFFMFVLFAVLYVGATAVCFYVLYRVLRAAIRDGIKDAMPGVPSSVRFDVPPPPPTTATTGVPR